MRYNHTTDYSVVKRNEVLMLHATWVNLDNIKLSERSQTQKDPDMTCPE